jgi:hypothetical protein
MREVFEGVVIPKDPKTERILPQLPKIRSNLTIPEGTSKVMWNDETQEFQTIPFAERDDLSLEQKNRLEKKTDADRPKTIVGSEVTKRTVLPSRVQMHAESDEEFMKIGENDD